MYKLIVSLPVNREFEGSLRLEEEGGRLVAGPFAVCGRADREVAGRHGNPSGHALLPFGDTPLGRYRIAGIQPTGRKTNLPAERFGPYGVVVLTPAAGDAALADANGRFCIVIQSGKLGPGRRLRPTCGSLRLTDRDQKTLVRALRKNHPSFCECVAATEPVAGRTVAKSASHEEADPPLAGSLLSLPVAVAASASFAADRLSPGGARIQRFAAPSFRMAAADTGGGGGGTGDSGYGDEPQGGGTIQPVPVPNTDAGFDVSPGNEPSPVNVPPQSPTGTITAANLTSTASDLATDNKADYASSGNVTHCSQFVRDFSAAVVGQPLPELQGQVSNQVSALDKSKDWTALNYSTNQQAALTQAQADANAGKLVVVAWVNPQPTATDTGHIAVVVPNPTSTASPDGMAPSGNWGMRVPYIAQAGTTVSPKTPLSYGFGSDKKPSLQIFVRNQ